MVLTTTNFANKTTQVFMAKFHIFTTLKNISLHPQVHESKYLTRGSHRHTTQVSRSTFLYRVASWRYSVIVQQYCLSLMPCSDQTQTTKHNIIHND